MNTSACFSKRGWVVKKVKRGKPVAFYKPILSHFKALCKDPISVFLVCTSLQSVNRPSK